MIVVTPDRRELVGRFNRWLTRHFGWVVAVSVEHDSRKLVKLEPMKRSEWDKRCVAQKEANHEL